MGEGIPRSGGPVPQHETDTILAMALANLPSFDDWCDYCFTQGHDDFSGCSPDGAEAIEARTARFMGIEPQVLAEHLTRLFEAPGFIADRYTDTQIAKATWFLFGSGSGYFHTIRSERVPQDKQIRCVKSVTTAYTHLFDRVCGRRGTDPDEELIHTVDVDMAVYMIWDMDHLEGAVSFQDSNPHLVEPALEILQTVLCKCRTGACLASALHGIGHVYTALKQRDMTIACRVQSMVDEFLGRPCIPEWVHEYATLAREGAVQ